MSLLQHVTPSPPLKTPRQTPFCSHLFTSLSQEIWEHYAAVCIPLAAGINWFRFIRINFGLEILTHLYPSQNLAYSFDSPTNLCFVCLPDCQSSAYQRTKSQVRMLQRLANAEKHQVSGSFRAQSTFQNHLFWCHGCWHLVTKCFNMGMLNTWYAQEDTSTQHRLLGFFLISFLITAIVYLPMHYPALVDRLSDTQLSKPTGEGAGLWNSGSRKALQSFFLVLNLNFDIIVFLNSGSLIKKVGRWRPAILSINTEPPDSTFIYSWANYRQGFFLCEERTLI